MWDLAEVNWLAVIVAGVVGFLLGGLWYGVFSKPWMHYTGITEKSARKATQAKWRSSMGRRLQATLQRRRVGAPAECGWRVRHGWSRHVLVAVGLVATVSLNNYLFAARPFGLYLIDVGYPVVAFTRSELILGLWQ